VAVPPTDSDKLPGEEIVVMTAVPPEPARARSEELDCLKGILILLVCVGHAIQFGMHGNADFWQDPVFKFIYIFHMPLFMAVAGYLSYAGQTRASSPAAYVAKRARSYVVPIFSWALAYQLVLLVAGRIGVGDLPYAVPKYALGSLWFLWTLLGSMVVTASAYGYGGRFGNFYLVLGVCLVMLLPDVGNIHLFQYIFPYFVVGFLFARWSVSRQVDLPRIGVAAVVLGIASVGCYLAWDRETYVYVSKMSLTPENAGNIVFRWVAGLVVSLAVVTAFFAFARYLPRWGRGFLASLGAGSLSIYLLQGFVFELVLRVSLRYGIGWIDGLLGYPLAFAFGIGVAYACRYLGERMARNRIVGFLLLGRRTQPAWLDR
jgi:fucose 4-O-acetylase-like acetyltransferase